MKPDGLEGTRPRPLSLELPTLWLLSRVNFLLHENYGLLGLGKEMKLETNIKFKDACHRNTSGTIRSYSHSLTGKQDPLLLPGCVFPWWYRTRRTRGRGRRDRLLPVTRVGRPSMEVWRRVATRSGATGGSPASTTRDSGLRVPSEVVSPSSTSTGRPPTGVWQTVNDLAVLGP